jgi:hypothetical protein
MMRRGDGACESSQARCAFCNSATVTERDFARASARREGEGDATSAPWRALSREGRLGILGAQRLVEAGRLAVAPERAQSLRLDGELLGFELARGESARRTRLAEGG